MGFFSRIFRSRSQQQERRDTRTAIVEALTRAIAERGYATHQDCADLGLPRSTVFYHLGMLVKHGEFRRSRGRYYLVSEIGNAATISNVVVRKSTAEMLQAVQASAPEPAPPPPSRRQPVLEVVQTKDLVRGESKSSPSESNDFARERDSAVRFSQRWLIHNTTRRDGEVRIRSWRNSQTARGK
jgi:hypothetical protein